MHPILVERKRLGLYLAAWLPLGGLLVLLLHLSTGILWMRACALALPTSMVYAFVCLAAWYPVRALPLGRTPWERLVTTHLTSAAAATAIWLVVGVLWAELLEATQVLPGIAAEFRRAGPVLAVFGLLFYLLAVTYHHLVVAFASSRDAQRRLLELDLLSREAELKLLRAQISPHFLFNALNSVAALTHSDPDGARTMCLRLAEFLRAGMRLGSRERIPLPEELALARSFLACERIRFGERLRLEEDIAPECAEALVPPLILQPLVENAILHGIATLIEGGTVRLEVRRTGPFVVLAVDNPCDTAEKRRGGQGVGLENVRQRLLRMYGAGASLEATRGEGRFRAEIRLPAESAATAAGSAPSVAQTVPADRAKDEVREV